MRIQKLLLIISVAGLSTFLAVAQSSDSEAQEKALKALREKMKELDNAKPATHAPVSKSPTPQKAAPPVATKKVEAAAPMSSTYADPAAQAKAIEALHKKQAEMDAQEGVNSKTAKADAARMAKEQKKQADEAARQAKAQAKVVKQQPEAKAVKQHPQAKKPVAVAVSPAPVVRAAPAAAAGLTADQVVSSSSLSKREKLDSLLKLYLADTINPREYHMHRAVIVAQP